MINKQLNLFELIANLSSFNHNEAEDLWAKLLETLSERDLSVFDHKELRQLFANDNKFADCTALTL